MLSLDLVAVVVLASQVVLLANRIPCFRRYARESRDCLHVVLRESVESVTNAEKPAQITNHSHRFYTPRLE